MRQTVKKWGEALLAALCVLAIVFAAVYTRQDDLRRLAARDAEAVRDQTLAEARQTAAWQPPTAQTPRVSYQSAARRDGGLWQFSPWVSYHGAYGQRVCAMGAGKATYAQAGEVRIAHDGQTETRYRGLRELYVRAGEAVQAGQALGIAEEAGFDVCALQNGTYIDPQRLLP